MTEEQLQELSTTLRAAIVQEIDSRIGRVIAVAEDAQEALQNTGSLARKLADVTTALVAADGALAQRLDRVEQVLGTFHRGGDPEETFDLVDEDWYDEEPRPEPRPEPKPVDTTPRIIRELRKRPGLLSR